jgi:LacI family transcriptional regulator
VNVFGTCLVNTRESERPLVTIRQVAHKAGVSIGTVSRVLNHKPGVGERTRQHVLTVVEELGYVPPKRLSLSVATVSHLGLLSRPISGGSLPADPFYGAVFHGVERACSEYRINLSFSTLDIVNGHLRSLPALVSDERISGVILVGAMPLEVVESIVASAQSPVVLVDNYFAGYDWDAVMTANARGAYMATEFLISHGHRHVTLLGGPDHPSIVERRDGYEQALEQHGLTPTIVPAEDITVEDGEQTAVEFLRQAPETTGIVCSNDPQAVGVLRTLQRLGYKVPDDFSLVGFDDINLVQFTSPPLTTIRVDREALGRMAVQLLLGRIGAPERLAIKSIVDVTLVERASVCSPRASDIVFNFES